MSWTSQQGNVALVGDGLGTALTQILMADDIQPGSDVSYELCKLIYLYHPLGKKMVDSPVEMAMAKPRTIVVPDGPEERVVEAFNLAWEAMGCDRYIQAVHATARTYGLATLAIGVDGSDSMQPLSLEQIAKKQPYLKVFDPLNTAGSIVTNQNPNAPDFLTAAGVSVNGQVWHPSRCCVVYNERPIYIAWTASAFGFVGRSVFQRALFPLKSFIRTMVADDMVATKVGVLVTKMRAPGSIVTRTMSELFGQKRQVVKSAQTGNVISIGIDEDIVSLNLQNIDGSLTVARNNVLLNVATAVPMPAKILNQETFAEGFGEGTEDAEQVIRYLEEVRRWMQPVHTFLDRVVQVRAWTPEFYASIQAEFPEYAKVPYEQAFYQWRNSFEANWPPLREEPESEKVKVDEVRIGALLQIVQLLMPIVDPQNMAKLLMWIADNLNENKTMFTSPLELDWEAIAVEAEQRKQEQDQKEPESD